MQSNSRTEGRVTSVLYCTPKIWNSQMSQNFFLSFCLNRHVNMLIHFSKLTLSPECAKQMCLYFFFSLSDLQSYHARPSLESLLAASTQMLMEVLSSSALDGLRPESIKLPRELSHNKKYSWKQEKNPVSKI